MMMWQGDPLINRYMREWVAPELKKRYDINLNIAPGQEVGASPRLAHNARTGMLDRHAALLVRTAQSGVA